MNSLGLLAFISREAEPLGVVVDFDGLADWLFEQQRPDGSYESALVGGFLEMMNLL